MLSPAVPAGSSDPTDQRGFTLLELMVVMAILTVVVVIAGTALFSLSQTANRNDAMVSEEQAASNIVAQLSRDIRSANSLSFPTGATTANEVQLAVNQASGGTVPVLWVYNSTAATLSREAAGQRELPGGQGPEQRGQPVDRFGLHLLHVLEQLVEPFDDEHLDQHDV